MKVRATRGDFGDAFKWADSTIGNVGYMAALSGALLVAEEGKLTISTTDVETSATVSIPAAIDEPGRVLVPRKLATTIARLPDAPVELTSDDRLTVCCGRVKATASLLHVEDFPTLPHIDADGVTIHADAMERVRAHVAPFTAGPKGEKPAHTGVRVEVSGGVASFVASDQYRLQWLELEADGEYPVGLVPPALFCIDGDVELAVGANHAQLSDRDHLVTSALIQGTFREPAALWPADGGVQVTVECAALLQALSRIETYTGRQGHPYCRLVADEGTLLIEGASDGDEIHDVVDAYATDSWSVLLCPPFLGSIVKAHRSDTVTISQLKPLTPMTVTSDDAALRSILMPISEKP